MLPAMELDDRVRALLADGQHEAAATAAIEALGPAVRRYLGGQLDPDDADDVYQLWADDVWRGLPGFRFECALRTWSFRLATRAVARWRRDLWRKRGERLPTSAGSRLALSVASRLQPGGRHDTLRQLRAQLSPEERALLVLRVDQELEWEEIAAILSEAGEPVEAATLRKRYERLKERLRDLSKESKDPKDSTGPRDPKDPTDPTDPEDT